MVAIETIRDEPDREHEFEMLWECYLSGQMTEKQWQSHLAEDDGLRDWLETRGFQRDNRGLDGR